MTLKRSCTNRVIEKSRNKIGLGWAILFSLLTLSARVLNQREPLIFSFYFYPVLLTNIAFIINWMEDILAGKPTGSAIRPMFRRCR